MPLVTKYIITNLINTLEEGEIYQINKAFRKYSRRYSNDKEFRLIRNEAIDYFDTRLSFHAAEKTSEKDEKVIHDLKKKLEEVKSVRFPPGLVENRYTRALRTRGQMHDDYRHGEQQMREDLHGR